ncbi:HU family DNA-binding protein [Clostridium tepidiprofundi]|nr:HU family DNA-binding protein [Clostridium tepidiprofundi]
MKTKIKKFIDVLEIRVKMNKAELITRMSEKSNLKKKDVEVVLKAFIETVEEALEQKEKVQLIGFGTFETRERAERKGRNPRTKEEITIPASTVPVFKAGKEFKERVNK